MAGGNWRTAYVLRACVENIGEAAKRLGPQVHAAHPHVPWRAVKGMRDRLSHGYDQINLDLLWRTVDEDLPGLAARIEEMMRAEGLWMAEPTAPPITARQPASPSALTTYPPLPGSGTVPPADEEDGERRRGGRGGRGR